MKMSFLTTKPYPGLRPFDAEELHIFFGRERQTDELLARLQKHRFLAVVGPSGCGKSSLVRAGMIPALQSGFMTDTGASWQITQMLPGDRPLMRLAEALLVPDLLGAERGKGPDSALYLKAALKRGPLSLVEVARESALCRNANLLLLVDQFEELFRFSQQSNLDEAEAFVALLLATAAQRELPIYVVITMRSDYLGNCTMFHGLPEAINESQYLTPRLTREECALAITGPAKVFGGRVEPDLVNRLLNDFGQDQDQLPLLQHALMRMWERRTASLGDGTTSPIVLTAQDYDSIGGLQNSLSRHGDEVLASLSPTQRRIAEAMFRRLVDFSSEKRDTRAWAYLSEVASIAGVPASDVAGVVEAFRCQACSFVTPREGPLEPNTLLHISHESLIRKWATLSEWVKDETDAITAYKRVREFALLWKQGKAGLWRTPDLDLALAWRRKVTPSEPWAARYGEVGDLAIALEFIDASEKEQRQEQALEQAKHARRLHRARRLAFVLGAISGGLLCSWLVYFYLFRWDYVQYFNSYTRQYDQPVGIGDKLSTKQVAHRRWSLKIIKEGRLGHVRRMEAVNAHLQPTTRHSIGNYLEYKDSSWFEEPGEVVAWEYEYGPKEHALSRWTKFIKGKVSGGLREVLYGGEPVTSETAVDARGKIVWRFVYTPTDPSLSDSKRIRRGYFVGPGGLPRSKSTEQRTIIEIEYTSDGYEQQVIYRNRGGKPIQGKDQAYGQEYRYGDSKTFGPVEYISLGPDGKPMIDEVGNAFLRIEKVDRFGNPEAETALDTQQKPVAIKFEKGGWTRLESKTDEYGRMTEESYFNQDKGKIPDSVNKYHQRKREYDLQGNLIKETYWDTTGQPTTDQNLCHGYAYEYQDDKLVKQTCQGADGKPSPNHDHYAIARFYYDEKTFLVMKKMYFDSDGNPAFLTHLDPEEEGEEKNDGYAGERYTRDEQGRIIKTEFLGTEGNLVETRHGFARIDTVYDRENHIAIKAFFGCAGQGVLHNRVGYAKWHQEYDPYGNIVKTRYYGISGERVNDNKDGVSGWAAKHDANGNMIEKVFFDHNDRPTKSADGTAGRREDYDDNDNMIKTTYIGLRGEAVNNKEGYAQVEYKYDLQARQVGAIYYGVSGQRVIGSEDRASGWLQEYDPAGRLTKLTFLNQADKPMTSAKGYARRDMQYDRHGRIKQQLYFDENGQPTITHNKIAGIECAYDDSGNRMELKYLDSKPGVLREYLDTYARVTYKYDTRGNVLEEAYYGANGKLKVPPRTECARFVKEYNASGRLITQSCYGANNTPITANPGGYVKSTYTYDANGYPVETRYLDSNNNPARVWAGLVPDGQFLTKSQYDRFGNLIAQEYYDKDARRVPGYTPSGKRCFRWTATYDYKGMKTSEECLQK